MKKSQHEMTQRTCGCDTMRLIHSFIAPLAIALFLAGCGGEGSTSSSAKLASIAITPASASIAKGLTVNFTATGTYTDKTTADITSQVTWASINATVASISGMGVATGVAVGGAAVTATLDNITSPAAPFTVTAAMVTGISISPSAPSSPLGTPVTFTANAAYSDGTIGDIFGAVTWTSSNTTVATLSSSGVASTLAQGSTTIAASTNDFTSNSVTLTVTAPTTVTATIPSISTTTVTAPTTIVGPFTVSYYNGTTFVASESVARPSINYAWADFNGIDSPNFHAIWTGNIEVFDTPKLIDMNFEVSWSDVSLVVDGVAIASWSNSNTTIQHEFSPGIHEVKIEYFNHWHTTGFDVSFTTNTMYSKADAIGLMAPQIDANTKIIYVGAYESADLYNNSTVTLSSATGKVFLFLTSYSSINWIIKNPANVTITGIAYSSYSTGATVTADTAIPQFEIAGLAYGYTDFSAPSADITSLIGRAPDYLSGAYGLTGAVILLP